MRSEGSKRIRCEVLHVNTERTMRGGEVQTLGLIRELEARGCPSTLVAWDLSPLLERAWGEGFQVIPWKPRGEWDLLSAYRLRQWVKLSGARVVHAHTAHALSLALFALRGLQPRPSLVMSRRVSFPLRSRLSRWKYRSADAVVAVSEEVRSGLIAQGLAPELVHAVHSGVDLARFQDLPSREAARSRFGIPAGSTAVGVVGALVPHKGHAVLMEALSRLVAKGFRLELLVVGEGPLKGRIRSAAKNLKVPYRFLGFVKRPALLYPALDALVLPSLSGEGSPGVIKEAAASCVPVVATDVSGTAEILRDGLEALIVPPGDPAALGASIARLLTEPGLAQSLVEAAHFRVREFTLERMAQAHLELYAELVGGKIGNSGPISGRGSTGSMGITA